MTVISPRKSGSAEVTDFELGLGPKSDELCEGPGMGLVAGVSSTPIPLLSGDAYTALAFRQPNDITEEGTFKVK